MKTIKKVDFPPDKKIYTLKEASFYLSLSEDYLRTLIKKGISPDHMQPAGKWGKILFHIDKLNEWIEENNLGKRRESQ